MNFKELEKSLEGEFYRDESLRRMYATDASAYREVPLAVATPKTEKDIQTLIHFAKTHKTSLIPRAAGTSLAGQVVGKGIVVDISQHLNKIVEINTKKKYVRVQPGLVRDELNRILQPLGYFFAPETSTSNRATIGGMIGNNSCGANSVVYGSTREHLLEVSTLLSDGSKVLFKETDQLFSKNDFENKIYENISNLLSSEKTRNEIFHSFPKPTIPRRNTGYALDLLAKMKPFNPKGSPFNFCTLIAGSEGTLAFITEAKLKIMPLPPPHKKLLCVHCHSIDESLKVNLVALQYEPYACELMDHYIFEATKRNPEQSQNRFFLEGNPKAVLVIELIKQSPDLLEKAIHSLIKELQNKQLGYAYPVISGDNISKIWSLRKAGLGLLSNIPGDEKPIPVVEDTAVSVSDLPAYIADFNKILKKYNLYSVHYAHAGSGELHLRPIINLKTKSGVKLFKIIAEEIAQLVKKYEGSLSGEHGDGRLRGKFIPKMIGKTNYERLRQLKCTWDPYQIFNPGKIIECPPIDQSLRFEAGVETKDFDTLMDFSKDQGILRAAEYCNGSGDCRKSHLMGGMMCPSYMATRREKDTTRARANVLREFLTHPLNSNPYEHEEIKEVMELCLSCKGCKIECPSNVDMAKLKAEWQYQYYKTKGIPWRTHLIANVSKSMKMFSYTPFLYNWTRNFTKYFLGFAKERSIPKIAPITLRKWYKKHFQPTQTKKNKKKIYFFFDEFTNYLDVEIGKKAILLLDRLGYQIAAVPHKASGRTYLSKGLLVQAKTLANANVNIFSKLLNEETFLIGVEPSAILTFRDEYPDLLRDEAKEKALKVSKYTFTMEEFLANEIEAGHLNSEDFTKEKRNILVHGHCHQKAISSINFTKEVLSTPKNFDVKLIPSGCCGMAGSFGYEKQHFEVSMKIGELVLFPEIRKTDENTIIVASGTSCRHQIYDGTKRKAYHLVELL